MSLTDYRTYHQDIAAEPARRLHTFEATMNAPLTLADLELAVTTMRTEDVPGDARVILGAGFVGARWEVPL